MNSNVNHIFFDLDHTLWDFDRNSGLAFKQLFKKHAIDLDLVTFLEFYKLINFHYWKLYREEKINKEELRRGRFGEAFSNFGLHFNTTELDALAHTYIEELPKNNYLFEGVLPLLDYLSSKYQLHIITNGFHQVQHKKLANSGIKQFFKTVTTSEEVGVKKPNPLIFTKAIEKATAHATQSVMIGDTFEADILGAENVGMQTIFFNYRNEKIDSNYQNVNQITEIRELL